MKVVGIGRVQRRFRAGTAPLAIVLGEPDLILAVGSVVAAELYGARVPILVLPLDGLEGGAHARIDEDGKVTAEHAASEAANGLEETGQV